MSEGERRQLRIRCATWGQVEAFYSTKLKGGKTLTIRLPFAPKVHTDLTVSLALPNDMTVALEARIVECLASDGVKATARLELFEIDAAVGRMKDLVAKARIGHQEPVAGTKRRRPRSEPPPTAPEDAPVNEVVASPQVPEPRPGDAREREVFRTLQADHRRLREAAAHQVLGVSSQPEVSEMRTAYFALVKRYHPDVFAKYRSPAVSHLASEVFVHVNKAYDRIRRTLAAAGTAVIAGPALLPHTGWIAGIDDLVTCDNGGAGNLSTEAVGSPGSGPGLPLSVEGLFRDVEPLARDPVGSQVGGPINVSPHSDEGNFETLLVSARALIANKMFADAQEQLAEALHVEPRNREWRSLYHVASGHALQAAGRPVDAMTQFETALAHNPGCVEAQQALEQARAVAPRHKSGLWRRLFEK